MTRKMRPWLALLALSLLAACQGHAEPENGISVYYASTADSAAASAIVSQLQALPEGKSPVEGALDLLGRDPGVQGLASPYPEGTRVNAWRQEGEILHIDFSEQYGRMTGIQLAIADCCTTLTLTQLDGIRKLSITAAGETLPERTSQLLQAEDVLLEDTASQPLELRICLWFPNQEGELAGEYRAVSVNEDSGRVMAVLRELCRGPRQKDLRPFLPPTPEGVIVQTEDGRCSINLPADWIDYFSPEAGGVPPQLGLQAIAGAVVELEGIRSVQFLINGEPLSDWRVPQK